MKLFFQRLLVTLGLLVVILAIGVWNRSSVASVSPGLGNFFATIASMLPGKIKTSNKISFNDETQSGGNGTGSIPSSGNSLNGPGSQSHEKIAAEIPVERGQVGPNSEVSIEKPPGKSAAEIKERTKRMAELKDKTVINNEFNELVSELTEANWQESVADLLPLLNNGVVNQGQWEVLMTRLGDLGGLLAMERFRPADPLASYDTYHSRFAMEGWAARDPVAAQAYVEALEDGRYKDGMAIGLFRTLTDNSRQQLESLFDRMPEALWPQVAASLRDVIRWEQTPEGPIDAWLRQTEGTYGLDSARYAAIKTAAQLDALEHASYAKDDAKSTSLAFEYFQKAATTSDRVLNTALHDISHSNPSLAMSYAEQYANQRPELRASIPTIVNSWSDSDLGAPGDWLNSHKSSPLYDPTAVAYVSWLANEDRAAAEHWANTIQDSKEKEMALHSLRTKVQKP